MTYEVAETRLRCALIPRLVGMETVGPMQSLFERLFQP